MLDKVLIANRGVIVTRILRTLRTLGIRSVVVYAEADRDAPYIRDADESFCLGDGSASSTYLNVPRLLEIIKQSGAKAVHPGYGFLSENADFIELCEENGIIWLGPTASQVKEFGYKHKARDLAKKAGVPLVPGTGILNSLEDAIKAADQIGYPIILKSTAGGGGIGMHVCETPETLQNSFDSVQELSLRNFGDGSVFLEAYVSKARHLEVQLFGDGKGSVISLGERDCSTQRRNQKVLEECPAPGISDKTRAELHDTAVRLGELVKYRSAGTVEFIYDTTRESFYFLEVNTRLQVEHGVTEMVWGVDIVELMVKLGSDMLPDLNDLRSQLHPRGHSIQARLYAEDPFNGFRPSTGLLTEVVFPESEYGVRVDTWVEAGVEVTPLFDPMLAKLISHAPTRPDAIEVLSKILEATYLYGIITNREWIAAVIRRDEFLTGDLSTRWLMQFTEWAPKACDIISPGTMTMIQDWPGRVGYWEVGVPPSGPFDDWSFRLGNRMLGNPENASGLEITISGPSIKFHAEASVVVTGAPLSVRINGNGVPQWELLQLAPGDRLDLGKIDSGGMRAYLLVLGGFECPDYLGSQSTFTLGQFGGHAGRQLRTGDRLMLAKKARTLPCSYKKIKPSLVAPELTDGKNKKWELFVTYGPHGAPDFFLEKDIQTFFNHEWDVHYNSSRTGIRLVGPRPEWARANGGEAGLHPSNIHDNAYAFGAVDFTGDMPIILGPDGPSLGGFVCPATVVRCNRWKLGQLAPGDKVRFTPISIETARGMEDSYLAVLSGDSDAVSFNVAAELGSPIMRQLTPDEAGVQLVYRRAGDDFILIEFGPMELDIALRFRAHAWMLWIQKQNISGVVDLTPGIRSLQVHYDPIVLPTPQLFYILKAAESELKEVENLVLETRRIRLPLSWDDVDCRKAIDYYARSVRANAPWVPSNLEFIRRINGLDSIDNVFDIVFNASYLVLGLGDVYLGAPVATPLDPRQRLVTTKYNPARTWTAENSVGIGGAYLCVYGMEGPGGYQFVGRTLQMWNRYHKTKFFSKPWLLRFFDQLSFYRVSHEELMEIRRDFPHGRYELGVEPVGFRLTDYIESLKPIKDSIDTFRKHRQTAFEAEIAMWHEKGLFTFDDQQQQSAEADETDLAEDETSVESSVAGSIWKILVQEGESVKAEQPLALIESMKMEFSIVAPSDGIVSRVSVQLGMGVTAGQGIVVLKLK